MRAFLILFFLSLSASAETPPYPRVESALAATRAGYLLTTLSSRVKTASYLTNFKKFLDSVPAQYELFGADADLGTGLKFAIFRPLATHAEGERAPWILAITGTEGALDWINNLDIGRPQFHGLEKIVKLFASQVVPDRELIVTGHSLGGALAQAVAHEILRERAQRGLKRQPLTLLTWNAFGATELVNRIGNLRPELVTELHTAHYFIQGDLVSRIGTHLGPTFELRTRSLLPRTPRLSQKLAETLRLHSLDLVASLLTENQGDGWRNARPASPPAQTTINRLTAVTFLLAPLLGTAHEFQQLWLARWMVKSLRESAAADRSSPAYSYIYNVGVTELARLRTDSDKDKVRDRNDLAAALNWFRSVRHRSSVSQQ